MTDASAPSRQDEERLISQAKANFAGFFRWITILNEMIQKEIGPKFGLIVNNPDVGVAEGTVSGTLDASRPGKPVLSIPFSIQGDQISFTHAKFEQTDKVTGQKTSTFTSRATDDVNRILSDIVQDYIG